MTNSVAVPKRVVVFGDFSCPFSALASQRAAALEKAERTAVEWRGVQHLPDQPIAGIRVDGDLAAMYEQEIAQIGSLLVGSEEFPLQIPPVQPNTGLAIACFATAAPDARPQFRQRLFEAFWFDGRDIGDAEVLADLGLPVSNRAIPAATAWQRKWESFENRMVPMLEMPNGHLARGLEALERLAEWTKDL